MITFIVEETAFDQAAAMAFTYAAQEQCEDVRTEKYVPFGGTLYNEIAKIEHLVIFYGSLNFIKDFHKQRIGSLPFAWCDWEKLSCHHYFAYYGKYLIHQEYGFYPFAELPRLKDSLFERYAKFSQQAYLKPSAGDKVFIRPDTNDKVFNGEVVDYSQFERWYELANFYEPAPTTLAMVSMPSKIESEYRFIVANGKVVTGSRYKIAGMLQPDREYDEKHVAFVEEIASVWEPHPIFVMDIADTYENGLRLLEIGPVNAAGFYACDVKAIVKAMIDVTKKNFNQ